MDEAAFHAARHGANPLPCVFEKALLAGCAGCTVSQRHSLAEREVVACRLPVAHINCATLAALLRERATFALHLPPPSAPLPHARAMQLQCGGLRGLQAVLGAPVLDVHALVSMAHDHHGSLMALRWDALVTHIQAWQMRRRSGPAAQNPA